MSSTVVTTRRATIRPNTYPASIAPAIRELSVAMNTAARIETAAIACPFLPYAHGQLIGHPDDSASLSQFMAHVTAEISPRGTPVTSLIIWRLPVTARFNRYFYAVLVGEFAYWAGGLRDDQTGRPELDRLKRYFGLIQHQRNLTPAQVQTLTRPIQQWTRTMGPVFDAVDRARDGNGAA